jgi:hypothetical protein
LGYSLRKINYSRDSAINTNLKPYVVKKPKWKTFKKKVPIKAVTTKEIDLLAPETEDCVNVKEISKM